MGGVGDGGGGGGWGGLGTREKNTIETANRGDKQSVFHFSAPADRGNNPAKTCLLNTSFSLLSGCSLNRSKSRAVADWGLGGVGGQRVPWGYFQTLPTTVIRTPLCLSSHHLQLLTYMSLTHCPRVDRLITSVFTSSTLVPSLLAAYISISATSLKTDWTV